MALLVPNERFPVEKPAVLKASTPGSHPIIRAVWRIGFGLLIGSVALFALHSFIYPLPAILAVGLFAGGLSAYLVRHARFLGTLSRGERALPMGRHAAAGAGAQSAWVPRRGGGRSPPRSPPPPGAPRRSSAWRG